MNLLKYIVLIFISSISFAQVKALEDYISVENNSSEVSNKIISNEDFLRVLIDEYYKLTFKEDLIDNELINYQIVKNEFDFNNINIKKISIINFLLNLKKIINTDIQIHLFQKIKIMLSFTNLTIQMD
ncbi:hypothetical protein [Empedobacter falsenii]|uniref:Uncharacterized protein n=1 Tax=Empedobacter falsenii TaxID=343874 RepID=A0AAW7DEL2_9FLAO|nr:hypothetical protein [Empedobacter falsenii]MDM1550113.1 hypothetical protein [Empedobacter falsenii]